MHLVNCLSIRAKLNAGFGVVLALLAASAGDRVPGLLPAQLRGVLHGRGSDPEGEESGADMLSAIADFHYSQTKYVVQGASQRANLLGDVATFRKAYAA